MRYLLSIVLLCGVASAEPGPVTKFLMGEPVTMWDWGLFHLENKLKEKLPGFRDTPPDSLWRHGVGIDYDADSDRLTIKLRVYYIPPPPYEREVHKGIDEQVKERCKISAQAARVFLSDEVLEISEIFQHKGFEMTNNMADGVFGMIDAEVHVTGYSAFSHCGWRGGERFNEGIYFFDEE
jgi:hypothetical protein